MYVYISQISTDIPVNVPNEWSNCSQLIATPSDWCRFLKVPHCQAGKCETFIIQTKSTNMIANSGVSFHLSGTRHNFALCGSKRPGKLSGRNARNVHSAGILRFDYTGTQKQEKQIIHCSHLDREERTCMKFRKVENAQYWSVQSKFLKCSRIQIEEENTVRSHTTDVSIERNFQT